MNKTLKISFTISLILNILLVGMFFGHMLGDHPMRPIRKFDINEHAKDLSAQQKDDLGKFIKSMDEKHHNTYNQVEEKRKELGNILGAPEFDEQAFTKNSKDMDAIFSNMHAEALDMTIGFAKTHDIQTRHVLAEYLHQPPMLRRRDDDKPK